MPSLVVSIHDVSPMTRESVETMLSGLETVGITSASLLIIPDHHHRGHFAADPAFCDWLRAKVAAGHEAVIHGYFHQRDPSGNEVWRDRFMTQFYTAGEGEFYDITEPEAAALYSRARQEFESAGLRPSGFIAPAWLLSNAAEKALKRLGCEYTTRLRGVTDLRDEKEYASQSLVYSVQTAWRRMASLAWNPCLFRRLRSNPLLRISLHPPDLRFPEIWRQALRFISLALEQRESITYVQWVMRNRPTPVCA